MSDACRPLTKEMLGGVIALRMDDAALTFQVARQAADEAAGAHDVDPMLISWFEASTGNHSPKVECCRDDKPGWLAYAHSRGGDLIITVNDLSYVFVYARSSGFENGP